MYYTPSVVFDSADAPNIDPIVSSGTTAYLDEDGAYVSDDY